MSTPAAARRTGRYRAHPVQSIAGEIRVPGDKSISHRALMLGAIARGRTEIENLLASEDCLATLAAFRELGVRIERDAGSVRIEGAGPEGLQAPTRPLDMGNAGTAMRLAMGVLAAQRFDSVLVGDASLMRRPMERVATPLRSMGADIATVGGRPPVRIRGGRKLRGIDYTLPVASAQVKSALLLAGLYAAGTTRISEPAASRDHTERMLKQFGAEVRREGPLVTLRGPQELKGTHLSVPGDFSSAAFFLVAGALAASSGILLLDVGVNATRAGLLDVLQRMGADVEVRVARSSPEPIADIRVRARPLRGIEVPRSLVPVVIDELPVFFIAAASAEGESLVRGAEELRVKESDRLAAMSAGLKVLGVEHELLPDGMRIRGRGAAFRGGRVDSFGDHRIAMAFAIASVRAEAPIDIDDIANVATSFPGFVEVARSIGFSIEVQESRA